MIEIVHNAIDSESVIRSVQHPRAGAIVTFIGTTRNHADGKVVLRLEYDAYMPMALKLMNRIAMEAKSRWETTGIAMVHRIGPVPIGDASVVIAVSAPHRKEAFEACRFLIDTLKKEVPIWKKEFFEDGEVWVGSEPRLLEEKK